MKPLNLLLYLLIVLFGISCFTTTKDKEHMDQQVNEYIDSTVLQVSSEQQKTLTTETKKGNGDLLANRLFFWFTLSLFIGILPFLIAVIGSSTSRFIKGNAYSQKRNDLWASLILMTVYSLVIGFVLFIIMATISIWQFFF